MPDTHTIEGDLYIPYYGTEQYLTTVGDKNLLDFLEDISIPDGCKVRITLEILPKEDPVVYEEYHSYTDEELCKEWNRLETVKLNDIVESKMDYIQAYLYDTRGVVAWNNKGEVTQRDERCVTLT